MSTMTPITPALQVREILFATDFTSSSRRAQKTAMFFAERFGARMHVLHAFNPVQLAPMMGYDMPGTAVVDLESGARQQLQRTVNDVKQHGITTQSILATGTPSESVAAAIRDLNIDLVVVGTHGAEGVERIVLGSVAEEIMRNASCPVITVGPSVVSHDPTIKRVLFATDFSPASLHAVPAAYAVAWENQAQLILLHVLPTEIESNPDTPRLTHYFEHELLHLLPPEAAEQCKIDLLLEQGRTADCILDVAEQRECDLIVLGVQSGHDYTSHFFAGLTYQVICNAPCPVMTVRQKPQEK